MADYATLLRDHITLTCRSIGGVCGRHSPLGQAQWRSRSLLRQGREQTENR